MKNQGNHGKNAEIWSDAAVKMLLLAIKRIAGMEEEDELTLGKKEIVSEVLTNALTSTEKLGHIERNPVYMSLEDIKALMAYNESLILTLNRKVHQHLLAERLTVNLAICPDSVKYECRVVRYNARFGTFVLELKLPRAIKYVKRKLFKKGYETQAKAASLYIKIDRNLCVSAYGHEPTQFGDDYFRRELEGHPCFPFPHAPERMLDLYVLPAVTDESNKMFFSFLRDHELELEARELSNTEPHGVDGWLARADAIGERFLK